MRSLGKLFPLYRLRYYVSVHKAVDYFVYIVLFHFSDRGIFPRNSLATIVYGVVNVLSQKNSFLFCFESPV